MGYAHHNRIALLAIFTAALLSCSGCADAERDQTPEKFDRMLAAGTFESLCFFVTFDGDSRRLPEDELEAECDCEVSTSHPLTYRETAFLIGGGDVATKEMSWQQLNYTPGPEGWRGEPSFCFPRDRVTVEADGGFSIR